MFLWECWQFSSLRPPQAQHTASKCRDLVQRLTVSEELEESGSFPTQAQATHSRLELSIKPHKFFTLALTPRLETTKISTLNKD